MIDSRGGSCDLVRTLTFGVVAVGVAALLLRMGAMLLPFILAFVIAYLSVPLANYLQVRLRASRAIISFSITISVTGLIALILFFSIPFIAKQILLIMQNLDKKSLSLILEQYLMGTIKHLLPSTAQDALSVISQNFADVSESIIQSLQVVGDDITASLFHTFNNFLIMLFTPILLYYMLKDWGRIVQGVLYIVPRKHLHTVLYIIRDIDKNVSMYIRGQLKVAAILSTVYAVLLYMTSVKFGLILGAVLGMCAIVPYVGFIFMSLIILLVSLRDFGHDTVEILKVVGVLLIGQIVDTAFVTPKIMEESINLSPVWMIFGVLVCGKLFGAVGAFFSMPILVVSVALIKQLIQIYKHSRIYH